MAWLVLITFSLVVAYVIVGYPMLLAAMARRGAQVIRKSNEYRPAISVLLAVRNGEAFLQAKLESLLASDYPKERMEILVLSNGSTDGTGEIAKRYGQQGVRLIEMPACGKPAALNTGAQHASHEVLLFTDVRQTIKKDSVASLMSCLADPRVGVASGYLVIRKGSLEEDNVGLYWRYERWIRSNLSALDSIFGATGAFYAMRRELFRPMPANLLVDDMYLPLHAYFQGLRLVIEPQAVVYDIPTDIDAEFRRKVRTLAGNFQILRAFPELLTFRNRQLLHFLSYKVGRLLLPWLFMGILIASFFLPNPWSTVAVGAQEVAYGLAWLDRWIPVGPLKRISSPLRTLTVMLAATACAATILFLPAERFWQPVKR